MEAQASVQHLDNLMCIRRLSLVNAPPFFGYSLTSRFLISFRRSELSAMVSIDPSEAVTLETIQCGRGGHGECPPPVRTVVCIQCRNREVKMSNYIQTNIRIDRFPMGFGLRPAGKEGVWGRVTSTLDWCEENYIVTDFVAEFWNTVSCVFHLIAMTEGIYSLRRLNVPLSEYSLYLMFACIGVIGIGSILFHATLQFHSQMLDELPMLYATTLTVFCMLRIFPSSRVNVLCLGLGLTAYSLLVTFFYLSFPNPVYHEIAFGFLVVTMVFLSPLQISHLSKQQPHLRKTPLLNTLWTLYYASIVSFASGFVLWLSENNRCEWFRSTRIRIGYPWRVLLEFHVWWHLGSSLSIYTVALRVSLMTVLSHGGKKVALRIQKEVEVWWMFGFVPRIHRTIAEDGGLIARKLA